MRRMTMVMGVLVVLGVMVLGSGLAMAAPTHAGTVVSSHSSSFSLLDILAKLFGFGSVTAKSDASRGQTQPAPTAPASVNPGGSVSTDGAIWGRCQYPPCG